MATMRVRVTRGPCAPLPAPAARQESIASHAQHFATGQAHILLLLPLVAELQKFPLALFLRENRPLRFHKLGPFRCGNMPSLSVDKHHDMAAAGKPLTIMA